MGLSSSRTIPAGPGLGGQDYSNLQRNNVFSSPKAGDRTSDPNYDGVNVFGDEASANVAAFGNAGARNKAWHKQV
jgi:hypothetical protein